MEPLPQAQAHKLTYIPWENIAPIYVIGLFLQCSEQAMKWAAVLGSRGVQPHRVKGARLYKKQGKVCICTPVTTEHGLGVDYYILMDNIDPTTLGLWQ